MATEAQAPKTELETTPNAIFDLQKAGLGNMMGIGGAWVEALSDMGAEVLAFVADRIKEDVKTQHEILHCKDLAELQNIQARFLQKAIDQYQAETGKLVEMSTSAFKASAQSDPKG